MKVTIFLLISLLFFQMYCYMGDHSNSNPFFLGSSPCDNITEFKLLNESNDMPAIQGSIQLQIPLQTLWSFASQLQYYPYWYYYYFFFLK